MIFKFRVKKKSLNDFSSGSTIHIYDVAIINCDVTITLLVAVSLFNVHITIIELWASKATRKVIYCNCSG